MKITKVDEANEAGFILSSGEMLKFTDDSHRGERQYDHRAIGIAYGVDVDLEVNHGFNEESNKYLDTMDQLPDTNPYRVHLTKMMHNITDEVPMEIPDIVLVMMHLNTEERIETFTDWVRTKFDGEHLRATAQEICRAAVWIHEGKMDLP